MHPSANLHYKPGQSGFSLVELMVAITIGLLILAGLSTIFLNSSKARGEVEKSNRQIENGRYAVQLLTEDLRLAGFYAEFDPAELPLPSAKPNPCLTATADLIAAMPLHIQGYDGGATLSCLDDVKTGTDILVVRHVSSCVAGTTNCDATVTGIPYFQASLCNAPTEMGSPDAANHFALNTDTASLTRHKRDCTTLANIRRYRTHIYFIANNDNAGDGIPTLKRAELGAGSFSIVPLAEGIENLQIEYGMDTNADGAPDAYSANPDSYNSCSGAACVTNWQNVVMAKLHLLARNTEATAGYSDGKTYTLGLKADGTANSVSIGADSLRPYKRHVYQAMVRLNNPAGRRE